MIRGTPQETAIMTGARLLVFERDHESARWGRNYFHPIAVLRPDDEGAKGPPIFHTVNTDSQIGARSNVRRNGWGAILRLSLLREQPSSACKQNRCRHC
jgi:hypothetical protein